MWLTGRLVPDHETIADFRKDSGPGIKQVCVQFIELCRLMGLLLRMPHADVAEAVNYFFPCQNTIGYDAAGNAYSTLYWSPVGKLRCGTHQSAMHLSYF